MSSLVLLSGFLVDLAHSVQSENRPNARKNAFLSCNFLRAQMIFFLSQALLKRLTAFLYWFVSIRPSVRLLQMTKILIWQRSFILFSASCYVSQGILIAKYEYFENFKTIKIWGSKYPSWYFRHALKRCGHCTMVQINSESGHKYRATHTPFAHSLALLTHSLARDWVTGYSAGGRRFS